MVQNGKLIYKATEHKCNASTKLSEEVLILISTLTIGVDKYCACIVLKYAAMKPFLRSTTRSVLNKGPF